MAMAPAPGSILLLDGASLACLAFVRSLGRAGIRVTVAENAPRALAGLSRYCWRYLACPSPLGDPAGFRQWLLAQVQGREYDVVTGTTDYTLPLLLEWREELWAHARVPVGEPAAFRALFDKGCTISTAQRAGLVTPTTYSLHTQADAERLAQQSRDRWPVVIKPRSSVVVAGARRVPTHVQYAFDAAALRAVLAHPQPDGAWPLVQEYVSGTGIGCFLLMHEGRVVRRFQHRRLRDKNPTGSGSCFRVGTPPSPELMEASERLLRAAQWNGLAMVEFRVAENGPAYLMEVNARPWGSMHLAMESGVDFPLAWWQCVTGQPVRAELDYETGIHSRYLAGDLQHLEKVMLGPPRGWQFPYPRRLPTLFSFLKFWGRKLRYDDFACGDDRPGWYGLQQYGRELWRRMARRAGLHGGEAGA